MAYLDEYNRIVSGAARQREDLIQKAERSDIGSLMRQSRLPKFNPNVAREAYSRASETLPERSSVTRGLEDYDLDPAFAALVNERVAPGQAFLDASTQQDVLSSDINRSFGQDRASFGLRAGQLQMARDLLRGQRGARGASRLSRSARKSDIGRTSRRQQFTRDEIDKAEKRQRESAETTAWLDVLSALGYTLPSVL